MYYKYKSDIPDNLTEIVNGYKNVSTINITKQSLKEDEYITISNIKMKNILDGYKLDESETSGEPIYRNGDYAIQINGEPVSKFYAKSDYEVTKETSIGLGLSDKEFFKQSLVKMEKINTEKDKVSIKDEYRMDFLKKNNIKNDIDLYKFIADNYYIENKFFSNVKTLKQNYSFNEFVLLSIPQVQGWKIIEGDVVGYVSYNGMANDYTYSIHIIDNNNVYYIICHDPRFNDEVFMNDFISTIEIL